MHAYMRAHALYLDVGIFSDTVINNTNVELSVSTMVDIRLLMQRYLSFRLWPSFAFSIYSTVDWKREDEEPKDAKDDTKESKGERVWKDGCRGREVLADGVTEQGGFRCELMGSQNRVDFAVSWWGHRTGWLSLLADEDTEQGGFRC